MKNFVRSRFPELRARTLGWLAAGLLVGAPFWPSALNVGAARAEEAAALDANLNLDSNLELSNGADAGETLGAPGLEGLRGTHPEHQFHVYVPARPDQVWSVLTDYDHLREFVPDMLESRLLEDHGSVKLIEQVGRSKWFLFGKKARVVLEVEEKRNQRMDFHVVDGDFNTFDGAWTLEPRQGGRATLLTYSLSASPKFFAPGFVIRKILDRDIPERMFAIRDRVVSLNPPLANVPGAATTPTGQAR